MAILSQLQGKDIALGSKVAEKTEGESQFTKIKQQIEAEITEEEPKEDKEEVKKTKK